MGSVSCIEKSLSGVHNNLLTVTCVLGFAIAHSDSSSILSGIIFTPNTYKKCFISLGNASATSSSSTKNAEFDSILLIISEEHVFLVADSDTTLLASFSIATAALH